MGCKKRRNAGEVKTIDTQASLNGRSEGVTHVIAAGGKVRGLAALTTEMVEEARLRHGTYPTATAALGRTMTAAAFLGADLKDTEKVMIEVVGDGPLGRIVAEVDAQGAVRGYVRNPQVHLPLNRSRKLDVAQAVGRGTFYVTKDMGLSYPYQGMVPLVSGEIGEDFAYYLQQSQQIPSAVAVGVLVDTDNSVRAAGGILIQLMPGAQDDEELISHIEARVQSMPLMSRAIDSGRSPLELLFTVLDGMDPRVSGEKSMAFLCSCSKERFSKGLIALGKEEITQMVDEDNGAEVVCNFCQERYLFSAYDLLALLTEAKGSE